MIPLHHEPHFIFRFSDDRIIPRFHLESVEAGRRVSVFRLDPVTGGRLNLIASATAGAGGWTWPSLSWGGRVSNCGGGQG